VDISRAGILNIVFWKGLDLRPNHEDKEMRLSTANSKDVEENGFRKGNAMSSCCIRVGLAGEDKMRHLRARCSYQLASKGTYQNIAYGHIESNLKADTHCLSLTQARLNSQTKSFLACLSIKPAFQYLLSCGTL